MAYQFDVNVNIQTAFQYTPLPKVNLSSCKLPKSWRRQFSKLCELNAQDQAALKTHLASTYSHHEELKHLIHIIYFRLSGALNVQLGVLSSNARAGIILKVKEGLNTCTQGFHIRLNSLVTSFQEPQNLQQLLFLVRKHLVEKTATNLTDDTHDHNRCFIVANNDGLGVEPYFSHDPYEGYIEDHEHREALSKTFSDEYRAFNLPFLLADVLRGVFLSYEYTGENASGIPYSTYGRIQEYLEQIGFSGYTPKEIFLLDRQQRIIDVNWKTITKGFFQLLQKQNFITTNQLIPQTLIECGHYAHFLKNHYDLCGFEKEIFSETYDDLEYCDLQEFYQLKMEYPQYYIKLKENLGPTYSCWIRETCITLLREFAMNDGHKREKNLSYFLSLIGTDRKTLQRIDELLSTDIRDKNILISSQRYPDAFEKLLGFFSRHFHFFSDHIIRLLANDNPHGNCLIATTFQSHGKGVESLLQFLQTHIKDLGTNTLTKLFTEFFPFSRDNFLMLAMHCLESDKVELVFQFLHDHRDLLDAETINTIIEQQNREEKTLVFLASDSPNLKYVLQFLQDHIEKIDTETLKEIFTPDVFNRAVLSKLTPSSLQLILNFLDQNSPRLGMVALKSFFASAGFCAYFHSARACEETTAFFLKNIEYFSCSDIGLFMSKHKYHLIDIKHFMYEGTVSLLKENLTSLSQSPHLHFSEKLIALATHIMTKQQFTDLFLEVSHTLHPKDACHLLRCGLDNNNALGQYFSPHFFSFFSPNFKKHIEAALQDAEKALLSKPPISKKRMRSETADETSAKSCKRSPK